MILPPLNNFVISATIELIFLKKLLSNEERE